MTDALSSDFRRLSFASLILLLPTLASRALAAILLPLYTTVLDPAEFGIVGLANTVTPVATTLLSVGLPSTVARLHFKQRTEEERRDFYGTVVAFQILIPAIVVGALHIAIAAGWIGELFRTLPNHPHFTLVLWSSYAACLPGIALQMLIVREQFKRAAKFSLFLSLTTLGFSVLMVLVLKRGALGQLEANVAAGAIQSVVSLAVVAPFISAQMSRVHLREALSFGLPLVPHLLGNWALAASDRWILERHVSAAELGRYSLGYTIGTIAGTINNSIAKGIFPIINRKLSDGSGDGVPRLGTYSLVLACWLGLGLSTVATDLVQWFTPAEYHGAAEVVPWVIAGFVFQNVYKLWSQGTFFSLRTRLVPLATAVGAGTSILLNIWLVPRFGILAAAVNTTVAYAVLAGLHGALSQWTGPIPWEYRHWTLLGVVTVTCYFLALPMAGTGGAGFAVGLAVSILVFPAALVATGVISRAEARSSIHWATRRVRRS